MLLGRWFVESMGGGGGGGGNVSGGCCGSSVGHDVVDDRVGRGRCRSQQSKLYIIFIETYVCLCLRAYPYYLDDL